MSANENTLETYDDGAYLHIVCAREQWTLCGTFAGMNFARGVVGDATQSADICNECFRRLVRHANDRIKAGTLHL